MWDNLLWPIGMLALAVWGVIEFAYLVSPEDPEDPEEE